MVRQKLPLRIHQSDGHYRLLTGAAIIFRLVLEDPPLPLEAGPLEWLRRRVRDQAFSSSEAAEWLGIPKRTLVRELTEATEAGKLARSGAGPGVQYRFVL